MKKSQCSSSSSLPIGILIFSSHSWSRHLASPLTLITDEIVAFFRVSGTGRGRSADFGSWSRSRRRGHFHIGLSLRSGWSGFGFRLGTSSCLSLRGFRV